METLKSLGGYAARAFLWGCWLEGNKMLFEDKFVEFNSHCGNLSLCASWWWPSIGITNSFVIVPFQ